MRLARQEKVNRLNRLLVQIGNVEQVLTRSRASQNRLQSRAYGCINVPIYIPG